MAPLLYFVVPCFNEDKVLPVTNRIFLDKLNDMIKRGKVDGGSRILFVDDGSTDDTWAVITSLSHADEHFSGIRLSRNRGHQNALLAGLMEAKDLCDITISMDCDGQDDIEAAEKMVDAFAAGNDIVYGVRSSREHDSPFKRGTAHCFYRLMRRLGAEVVYDHADYRLMSKRVLSELANYKEVNLFLRGMVPLLGFKSTTVEYARGSRAAGKSHYPLRKMIGFAADGITSLSVKPLHIITWMGVIVAILSFIGVIWAFVMAIAGKTVSGWSSTVCIVCFVSGIQLISLGVIGEYVGKIYLETKGRPRYIISERTEKIQ